MNGFYWIGMIPMIAVILVGTVLASRNLHRFPRPCWMLLAALALQAFNLISSFLFPFVIRFLNGPSSFVDPSLSYLLFTFSHSVNQTISWCLVIFAILDRTVPPKFLREDDPDRDILDR